MTDYQNGPRGRYEDERPPPPLHYQNRSWVSDPRPPAPQRSASNMGDPRRASHNAQDATDPRLPRPDKRNASRSPEGMRPQKHSRPESVYDNTSRRSSASNSTPRHPGYENRHSSLHNGVELTSKGSPDNRTREGLSSGQSTPKPQPGNSRDGLETTRALAEAPPPAPAPAISHNAGNNDLIAALGNFMSQCGEFAALQYKKNEAEAQFERHEVVYNANKMHFATYPNLRDRISKSRDEVQEKLRSAQRDLDGFNSRQQTQNSHLAGLINPPQPMLSKDDFVPAEAFAELKRSYEAFQKDFSSVKGTTNGNKIELGHVRKTQVAADEKLSQFDASMKDNQVIKTKVDELVSWKRTAENKLDQVGEAVEKSRLAEQNVATLFDWKKVTVNDIDDVKQRIDKAGTNATTMSTDISGLRETQNSLGKKIDELAATKATLADMSTSVTKQIRSIDEELAQVKKDVPSKKEVNEFEERQDRFDQRLVALDKKFVEEVRNARAIDTARSAESAPPATTNATNGIRLSDTSTVNTGDSNLGERVNDPNRRVRDLETGRESRQDFTRPQTDNARLPSDTDSVQNVVQELRDDFDHFEKTHQVVQDTVIEHVNKTVQGVELKLEKIEKSRADDKPVQDALFAKHDAHLNALQNNVDSLTGVRTTIDKMTRSLEHVTMKQDQLVSVFENLKFRYDNLTTDDVVKAMLNQLSSILPNATNVEESFNKHSNTVHRIASDLEKLQANVVKMGLTDNQREVLRQLQQNVNSISSANNRYRELLDRLNVDKLNGSLQELQSKVSEHDQLRAEVNDMRLALASFHGTSESMKNKLGTLEGKIDAIDEQIHN